MQFEILQLVMEQDGPSHIKLLHEKKADCFGWRDASTGGKVVLLLHYWEIS